MILMRLLGVLPSNVWHNNERVSPFDGMLKSFSLYIGQVMCADANGSLGDVFVGATDSANENEHFACDDAKTKI